MQLTQGGRIPLSEIAPHAEVEVRVKVLVDERIAPIVAALNDFPGLFTDSSCQGDEPDGPGVVTFSYGDNWQEAAAFCLWLREEFGQRREEGAGLRLTCMRWHQVAASMCVEWAAVDRVAAELRALAYTFTPQHIANAQTRAADVGVQL
jgi:hypothetical protein